VSRSGGMSNELNNIIMRNTNGVYEGVAIGGDRCGCDCLLVVMLLLLFAGIQGHHLPIIYFDIMMTLM